jgi:hypothetical protein
MIHLQDYFHHSGLSLEDIAMDNSGMAAQSSSFARGQLHCLFQNPPPFQNEAS